MRKIKILCLLFFIGLAFWGLTKSDRLLTHAGAFSSGPPVGSTGAPGETTCTNCHIANPGSGQFSITAPATYTPGQTYQIVVRHQTVDASRRRWGFQLTSLAGTTPAGTFANLSGNTQISSGAGGRDYIEHTTAGTFAGQAGSAVWTFNWTAPATNVGAVTLFSAGNQANNNGSSDGDQIYTTSATIQPAAPTAPRAPIFDFDNDDKTDISIFRPSTGEWWISRSGDNQTVAVQFGLSTDTLVPADFTGDGRTDIAFWRASTGEWFVLRSEDGTFYAFPFGANGDIPTPADFDADGKADPAVFRPSSATWFIQKSTGGTTIQAFGVAGDVPVAGDYDGDGRADLAIFRANGVSGAEWWHQRSSDNQVRALQFGSATDKAVPGDYTGDGKTDIAFYRPQTSEWFVLRSEDFTFFAFPFGAAGDVPAPGDYDGDGRFDAAVFRPSITTWFAQRSTGAGTLIQPFGLSDDIPLPAAFLR